MRLVELSVEARKRLLDHIETYLGDASPRFREDVLYAVGITAPLRERTYLVRLAAEISGTEWPKVEPFAFAAEILMVSALTADDVIDGSVLRSGKQSLVSKTDSARAFLVAEYLHSVAHNVLCRRVLSVGEDVWDKAAKEFRSAFCDLLIHQHLESSLQRDGSVTVEQIDILARGRTGRLIEACLVAPAIISGSKSLAADLAECGKWLGMVLQHRDDILDFIGEPEVIGKPILLNLLDGQPNLVLSHALTRATDESARSTILKYFGAGAGCVDTDGEGAGDSIQAEVVEALRACGSLDYARKVVEDYCAQALRAVDNIRPSQAKEELLCMIDLIARIEFPWEDAE